MNVIEEKVKQRLIERGFSEDHLINNRGLIGATIDDTLFYAGKITKDPIKFSEKDWSKATDAELIAEAKRRYPKGTEFKCLSGSSVAIISSGKFDISEESCYKGYIYNRDSFSLTGSKGLVFIPQHNVWAEVVSQPTTQEEPKAGDMVEVTNDINEPFGGVFQYTGFKYRGRFVVVDNDELTHWTFIRLPQKSEVESKAKEYANSIRPLDGLDKHDAPYLTAFEHNGNIEDAWIVGCKWGQQNPNAK